MNHLHHHLVDRKLLRFAAIGTANTILGMGIMFGMYNWLGCGYWVSTAANYLITSVISFFANKYLTFHNQQKSIRQAFRFAANIALCYVFAFSVAKPLVIRLMSGTMCRKMCPCWSEWDCSPAAITWDSGWLCSER